MPRSRSPRHGRYYLEAPIRRRWLVIAPAVIAAAAAVALALLSPGSYRATAVVRVEWRADRDGIVRQALPELEERRARAVGERVHAASVLERVLEATTPYPEPAGGGLAAQAAKVQRLRSDLRLRQMAPSTFAIEYVHDEAAKAAQVANLVADLLVRPADGAEPGDATIAGFARLIQAATPAAAESRSPLRSALAGALLGLLLGLLAALVAERRDPSIKGPEDLEDILPVPLLVTLPELRGRKRGE